MSTKKQPRFGTPQYTGRTVLDEARDRTRLVFDLFDHVAVSFSGGKDSTAVLNIALEVARELKRLPLHVITFDEECIPPQTVEYMQRVSECPDIKFDWYCLPVQHRNACSSKHPYWYCWHPDDRDKWVRELPPSAITTPPPGFRHGMSVADCTPLMFPPTLGTVGLMLGIRAAESLTRRRAVTIKRGDRAFLVQLDQSPHISKAYPVYDWSTEDVWRAPSLLGWDYNRAYDVMEAAGITRNAARCSPPYGEQPYRGLAKFKTCWPDLWAKMTQRVHGAATAARYSTTELYGSRMSGDTTLELPPEFKTWKAYAMAKMAALAPQARKEVADGIHACVRVHENRSNDQLPDEEPHPMTGYCWREIAVIAIIGGNKLGRQSQKVMERAIHVRAANGVKQ